ncbi:MAG: hypothetical protein ACK4VN_12205 [Bacteroidales bacterium]
MNTNRVHYVTVTLVALTLFTLSVLAYLLLPQALVSDFLLWIVPFFFIMALVSRYMNAGRIKQDPRKSVAVSLAASGLKLGVYLIVLILYGILNKHDAPAFFISFLIVYLVFTFAEVRLALWEASK